METVQFNTAGTDPAPASNLFYRLSDACETALLNKELCRRITHTHTGSCLKNSAVYFICFISVSENYIAVS